MAAIFLSLPPPIMGTPPFPHREFLESPWISQVLCEFVLLAALKFLFLLFCLQRPTEGHTTAGCRFSLTSVPRLPIPGVKLLIFVPAMLLLASAAAAGSKAVDV